MPHKKIILGATTFKYPTKEERKRIKNTIPKIKRLKVAYKSAFIGILDRQPYETAIRDEDIYWWSNCLNNRLGKLTETYIYVKTHFFRIQDVRKPDAKNQHTDKLLLDYYVEIFYYYFFSTRDVLAQLINIVENLKIQEDKIFFRENFPSLISSIKLKGPLQDFFTKTKNSCGTRNVFNHRFTPTYIDNRAKSNILKEGNTISFSYPKEVRIETFVEDIDNLMKQLGELMNILTAEIK